MEGKCGSECLLKPVSNIDFNPLIIKQAVIYNLCDVHIDLIEFTPGQAYSMLRVLKAKGYSDCNIMFTDSTPDYLTVHLNTSNLRSKE